MNLSAGLIRKLEDLDPKMKDVFLCFMEEVDEKTKIISVGRSDFEDLKGIVRQLAEAQGRTEHRLEELAEAQGRTEHRLEELAEAQGRTEHRLEELAEAQKRTEISVKALSVGLKDLRSQVGGLSMSVGYGIEDRLIPHLKQFAFQEFGVEVTLVDRRNITYPDGKYDEVNLYVEGKKDSIPVFLIGECKAQPGKKDFDRFAKRIERLQNVLKGQITALMVGYHYTPEVEAYADRLYPSILHYKTFQIAALG
jgi:predicted transcriptional regulator